MTFLAEATSIIYLNGAWNPTKPKNKAKEAHLAGIFSMTVRFLSKCIRAWYFYYRRVILITNKYKLWNLNFYWTGANKQQYVNRVWKVHTAI